MLPCAGKFIPRPVTPNDADIQTIRDPWFQEIFNQTNSSIFAEEPLRGDFWDFMLSLGPLSGTPLWRLFHQVA